MRTFHRLLLAALLMLVGFAAVGAGGPTDVDLTSDLAQIDKQISDAIRRGASYSPQSVIAVQNDLEVQVLKTTRAMIEQKKASWLRGIALTFTSEGRPLPPSSSNDVSP